MSKGISLDSIPHLNAWRWGVPLVSILLMLLLWISDANTQVFLALNHAASHMSDTFWSHVTVIADMVAILLILPFCGRRPQVVWHFLVAALFAILWTQSLKSPLGVMRPPAVLDIAQFHTIGTLFLGNAFPSGHTTTIFVIAGVLCLQRFPFVFKLGLLMLAILIGLSRIACGVHWPLDVLGGAFGGWLAAVAGGWVSSRYSIGLRDSFQRIAAVLLLSIALWIIFRDTDEFATTIPFQIFLALIALGTSASGLIRLFGNKG